MTSEYDKSLFDEVLKTNFYDGGDDIRWDDIISAPDQGPFTITTHPDGSWTDGSLQEPLKTEAAHQQAVTSDLHSGLSSENTFAASVGVEGYYRRSVDAESHISAFYTRSGSGAPRSERVSGDTFSSIVPSEGRILASSACWDLSKDIPPPGSVAPIAYCTLELFSRWLSEHEPYLPQATAQRLAILEVREKYKKNRQLYAFIRWAAKVSNSTDDVPDKFCFLCFEAVGIFYPQGEGTKGVTCACDFVRMGKRSEFAIAKSRKYTPRDGCHIQQQSGLVASQHAPSQIAASDEIPENSWQSCGTPSSTPNGSGMSLSKRSPRAPCRPLAPTGGTIPAKSKSNKRSKTRVPGSRKGDPLAKGEVVEIPHCTLERYSEYLAKTKLSGPLPTPEDLEHRATRQKHRVRELKGFIAWAATESGQTNDFKGTICWECFEYTGKFHPKRTRNDDAACRCESVTQATLWKFQDNAKVGTLRFPIYAFEGTAEKHQVLANTTIVTVA